MAEILHAAGITDELLAERICQGLNATIVSKKTAYARREVLVDYRERRKMVELVLRLKGELTNKHEIQPTGDLPTKIVIEYVGANVTAVAVKGRHFCTDRGTCVMNVRTNCRTVPHRTRIQERNKSQTSPSRNRQLHE